jgi:hypothetical protein
MHKAINHLVAVAVLVLSGTAVAGVATAAPGPGTFTTITTPSHDITYHLRPSPAINHLTISGKTSHLVTSVDIYCIVLTHNGPQAQDIALGVTVTGGAFSTVAALDSVLITCRLRAVPTGVDPASDYLGSYSGPVLHTWTFAHSTDGANDVGFLAFSEVGTGVVAASDAALCGVNGILTFVLPDVALRAPGTGEFCAFSLPAGNIVAGTNNSDAPAIRVDGKNAYLPDSVSAYLRASTGDGGLQLTLPQSTDTASFTRHTNGDMTVIEKSPLKRCEGTLSNTYPPTSTSCTTLVGTGVTFKRVLNIIRGAHQVELRDSFISTDNHKHNVSAQYQFNAPGGDTGAPGYIYPHHGTHFVRAAHDKVVTGFGSGPASVFVRSDIYALRTDDQADTVAWTWSRPPSRIQFSHASDRTFAVPYAFSVPAKGSANIGFAESESPSTAGVKKLAAKAQAEV